MSTLVELATAKPLYVCAKCFASENEVRATEAPKPSVNVDDLPVEIIVDHTAKPALRMPRGPKSKMPSKGCKHVWITEEAFLAGEANVIKARLNEAISLADQMADDEERRAIADAKNTYDFKLAAQQRMERAWLAIKTECVWGTMVTDWKLAPRMLVIKVNGTGMIKNYKSKGVVPVKYWPNLFPTHRSYTEAVDKLANVISLGFGKFHALAKHEAARKGRNPHTHFLFQYPFNEDGTPKLASFPKGSEYAEYNGLTFEVFVEMFWGTLSKQKYDISNPVCTWVATTEKQVRPLETVQDHVERYIDYARKNGKKYRKNGKDKQNQLPPAWFGQGQFSFWKTYGFTNLRRTASEPVRFEARTPAAKAYAKKWMAEHNNAGVAVIEVEERDAWGIPTGRMVEKTVGAYRPDSTQGGTSREKATDEQITELRQKLSYYNSQKYDVAPAKVVTEPQPVFDPDFVVEHAEPIRVSVRYLYELSKQAPSWWERPDAGEYLEAMVEELGNVA